MLFRSREAMKKEKKKSTDDQKVNWGEEKGVDLQIVLMKKLTRLAFLA